ncbi:COP23 domain-containing protein [Coleofasciculus sp. FACHB-SPT36]|uniref:COP23 domain-containing protein n=1 Tax=Cyanophyceae TaxID=3028117 RepID=UPI00168BD407|nr:COP23 domain-containing protein [Coleofasciculus sp. FACHB-SPT36]MBD2540960.1 hypothetical protein [Coleofasciculus sp. FACHB-SPT36]
MSNGQQQPKGKHLFNTANLTIALVSMLATVGGFAVALVLGFPPEIFPRQTRFSCTLQPDTENGGEVWTVMYRKDKEGKPWLKMVNSFGEDWDTRTRCDAIAQRLEGFREEGLVGFSHRSDPKTPKQSVICALTKLDRNNCNLLVTLKPGADGYESLQRMTKALRNGTTVEQGSGVASSSTSPDSNEVNLEDQQLAAEDR